jgi:hypothetical protein
MKQGILVPILVAMVAGVMLLSSGMAGVPQAPRVGGLLV